MRGYRHPQFLQAFSVLRGGNSRHTADVLRGYDRSEVAWILSSQRARQHLRNTHRQKAFEEVGSFKICDSFSFETESQQHFRVRKGRAAFNELGIAQILILILRLFVKFPPSNQNNFKPRIRACKSVKSQTNWQIRAVPQKHQVVAAGREAKDSASKR